MKQRLKRLFFPDFCFDKPAKYNRTTLHRKIFCLLLYLGFLTLHLSITLFLHASFMICLFCITVMAFMLTPRRQQMEYLKAFPLSAREYALGRLIWSVGFALFSAVFYALVFLLVREKHMVAYGLPKPLTFGKILLFALVHFSLVVLSCELTVLIRTRLSAIGFLWILIPLTVAALASIMIDSNRPVMAYIWLQYITMPVSISIFILSMALTAVCFLGTVRSLERWEMTGQKLSPLKPLLIAAAVLAIIVSCSFLINQNHYTSPVDKTLSPEQQYQVAVQCQEDGDLYGAATALYASGGYQAAVEQWRIIAPPSTVAATDNQLFALTNDGNILVAGDGTLTAEDIAEPERLVSIHAGPDYLVGLYDNGTVAVFGEPPRGGGEQAESWTDIVSLSVCFDYIAGIRADGSVVVCGFTFESMARDMAEWENILAIGASDAHIIGLHPNGTVSSGGTNDSGRSNVWHWKDIVDISAGSLHSVGLRSDGTVVAIGHNGWGQCDTDDWTDIIAIDADWYYTIGLRSDGTVLTAGRIWADMEPTGWTDIVAIYGIGYTIAGLKSDGTLVITDTQDYTQDDVAQWSNIRLPG